MATQRENVRAGLFVLMGIILGMVVIYLLTDFRSLFAQTQAVRVYYRLDDGLRGLKVGAAVTLGNVPVGEVVAIEDYERDGILVGQVVTFEMPKRYPFFKDARVELDVPTFGSGTKVNIRSLGTKERYSPDTVLPGMVASNPLAQDVVNNAGIDAQRREQVQQIIANLAAITDALKTDLPEITGGARRVLDKVEPIAAQAQQALDELQKTLADARSMVTTAKERSAGWYERIDSIAASADQTLARINELVADADPNLRDAAEQIKTMTAHLNDRTLPKVDAVFDDVKVVSEETRMLMVSQRPVIERALANMQLAAGQLKLAMIEVRRSPWRLLYKPDKAEIAHDNLYDAARSFAMGASALDTAAASLRATMDSQAGDDARIKAIVEYLDALFGRFHEAEQALWKQMEATKP